MQEEADPVLQTPRPQPLAQRYQVIIVDPDEVVFLNQRGDTVREALINPLVALAGLAFVFGEVEAEMEQRPQRGIGIAVVILVDVAMREVDRRGGNAFVALRRNLAALVVALRAGPAEPDALIIAQRGIERAGQTALCSCGTSGLRNGDPVRNDDELAYRTSLHGLDNSPAQLITPTSE
jgi:hypothetical protein